MKRCHKIHHTSSEFRYENSDLIRLNVFFFRVWWTIGHIPPPALWEETCLPCFFSIWSSKLCCLKAPQVRLPKQQQVAVHMQSPWEPPVAVFTPMRKHVQSLKTDLYTESNDMHQKSPSFGHTHMMLEVLLLLYPPLMPLPTGIVRR